MFLVDLYCAHVYSIGMKCMLCKKEIPTERVTNRTKYCSDLCNKRSHYLRKGKFKTSTLLTPDIISSETHKGFYWEKKVAEILGGKCLSEDRMNQDIDLVWNGKNVDVKVCELYKRKTKRGKKVKNTTGWWVFNRNKIKSIIDLFVCVCLHQDKVVKMYAIPSDAFPKSGVTIGGESKYDVYLIDTPLT